MAPETVVKQNGVDNRSDIYALGCVAYWLTTGQLVFDTDSGVAQIVEHVKMKCLEKDPADRFQGAREMATALREVPLAAPWDSRRADEWWDLHMRAPAVAQAPQ